MGAEERAELEGLVSASIIVLRAVLFLAVVCVVGWVAMGLQQVAGRALAQSLDQPVWIVPTMIFALLLYRRAARWTGGRAFRAQVRRDLKRGEIARHCVVVIDAVESPEVEDEGPLFFVREEGGATLFFSGQDMARHKSKGFPWTSFEILESPESQHFFGLRPLGEPMSGVHVRSPLEYSEAKNLGVFSKNFGELEKSLDELRDA